MSTTVIRKQLIRVHPLFQSLQPLLAFTVLIVALAVTIALSGGGGDTPVPDWSRVETLGEVVLSDAGWLLPALISVNLALVALQYAQTVSHADATLAASTKQVTTAGSAFIGACAASVVLISAAPLPRNPAMSGHFFAVFMLAGIIIAISLWMSVLFFGSPARQLAVAQELQRVTKVTLATLGPAGPIPAWLAFVVNIVVVFVASILVHMAASATSGAPMPSIAGEVAVLATLTVIATAMSYFVELGFAEWFSGAGLGLARVLVVVLIFAPLFTVGVILLFSGFAAVGLGIMTGALLPLASAWIPIGGWAGRWTLRVAAHTKTRARLQSQDDQLQAFIDDLYRRQSLLVLL